MTDREFTEVELRRMLEHARGFHPDIIEGRWIIDAHHKRSAWVTAYPVEKRKL